MLHLQIPVVVGGGANVKSGTVSVTTDTWSSVTFSTAFTSIPRVVCTFEIDPKDSLVEPLQIRNITTTGFEVNFDRKNVATFTVHWTATDAGN